MPDDKLYSINGHKPYVRILGPGSWAHYKTCLIVVHGAIGKEFWNANSIIQVHEDALKPVESTKESA